jgi:IS30 family transposase
VVTPARLAGWLKRTHPDDKAHRVSHETIYKSLFVQARGVLKKELMAHLRAAGAIRRSRHATAKADSRGRIVGAISIRERPASAEDRAVPGHWEGDLLCGSANSYIVTLVERHSRYVMLARIAHRDSRSVVNALIEQARALPAELYKSLTWDRRPRRWPSTSASTWQRKSPFTSAIRGALGSAAPTRIPIGCCASVSPRALIWQPTPRTS